MNLIKLMSLVVIESFFALAGYFSSFSVLTFRIFGHFVICHFLWTYSHNEEPHKNLHIGNIVKFWYCLFFTINSFSAFFDLCSSWIPYFSIDEIKISLSVLL